MQKFTRNDSLFAKKNFRIMSKYRIFLLINEKFLLHINILLNLLHLFQILKKTLQQCTVVVKRTVIVKELKN